MCFSVDDLAALWKVQPGTIRHLFRNEPGVIVRRIGVFKRRLESMTIPESVAGRVYERLCGTEELNAGASESAKPRKMGGQSDDVREALHGSGAG